MGLHLDGPPQAGVNSSLGAADLALLARTPEARKYAAKELARRAGASREFFLTWDIACSNQRTTISVPGASSKKIHFECAHPESLKRIISGEIAVTRAKYIRETKNGQIDKDLVIPFCGAPAEPAPLFQELSDGSYICKSDLLLSMLLTLGRFEETISNRRDEHGRFPGSASISVRDDFLERPIVDEYGIAFQQVLRAVLPGWRPEPRTLRVKLTHDIDSVGMPFQPRATIGHTLKRKKPGATLRDLLAAMSSIEPAELRLVRLLGEISASRGLHSCFYWKGSPRTSMDEGYDPFQRKVQRVIRDLKAQGYEMGVHPGYNTFRSRPELRSEVERLKEAVGETRLGGRQHYLRWSPETWLDWEACGLVYDSTVGFADRIGFRAGTCVPYRPWSLLVNRELNLLEVPLVVMDCTPVKYMGLPKPEGLERIRRCVEQVARVGGIFTILWHNVPLMEPAYHGWYEAILDMLGNGKPYVIPADIEAIW